MKTSRLFSQGIIMAIILAFTVSARAEYIVDTGPGLNTRGGNALYNTIPWNGDYQFLAVKFSLNASYLLTNIQGWIWHKELQNPSHINFIIYGDGGDVPDVNNELYNQVVTVSSNFAPQWHGLTGLDWRLSSGDYWLAFEARQPELNDNGMPGGAPNPQINEAYNNGGNNIYFPGSLGLGVTIQGTPTTVLAIEIDIKPGSYQNIINLKSKGVIPIAILTNEDFDATLVDPSTVVFGPNEAVEAHGKGQIHDVDGDGDFDLILHFNTQETGIICADIEADLTGETFEGQVIEGFDSINIVKCY